MVHKISSFSKHGLGIVGGLLLFTLGACTVPQTPPTSVVLLPPPAPVRTEAPATALSPEADSALKDAEQNVREARAQRALWIAAVEELQKARAAARVFDSEATLAHAREVVTLCALSLQQKQAPPVSW
ncbi:MAG TPA: hypothetical protein VF928_03920 [Usitatibacteraceae bacterium]